MIRQSVYFTGSKEVEIRDEQPRECPPDRVRVRTLYSGISAGTEMLVYRHQVPGQMPVDTGIQSLQGQFEYPMKYGYSLVGEITETGSEVDASLEGKRIFAFHPHESTFLAHPPELIELPDDLTPEEGVFLPNMETAVNLVMDGQPTIGEQIVILGQGVVGLLTTRVLSQYPGATIYTVDAYQSRRNASIQFGANQSFATDEESIVNLQKLLFSAEDTDGADLLYEVSGAPEALNQCLEYVGFGGRIIVGSWYGTKPVNLNMGGRFHRDRVTIQSSQVSTIESRYRDRWTTSRRLQVAMDALQNSSLQSLITHRFPIADAARAYQLIDEHPEKTIQVILTY